MCKEVGALCHPIWEAGARMLLQSRKRCQIKVLVILSPLKPLLTCLLTLHVPVQALVAIDVEDLEVDATPEDLMLSYVSGEKGKVRLWATCNSLDD